MEDEEGDRGVQQVDFIFIQHDIVVQPAVAQENQGTPLAQKAKLCFKLLLLQRLDENLKQKHF